MDWTEEVIEQLRQLWDEGHSTAEIGRRMGISKNAVVGKAHRLCLPPRPSPIRREEGGPRATTARRASGPTLPPLPATPAATVVVEIATKTEEAQAAPAVEPVSAAPPPVPEQKPQIVAEPVKPAPAATIRPAASRPVLKPVATKTVRRTASCCWPIGEPGTSQFHFCDAEAVQGRPYCVEHVQLAYVKVRDRRDDAA